MHSTYWYILLIYAPFMSLLFDHLNVSIIMPRRMNMSLLGTLRDQLIYPLNADQEVQPLTSNGMIDLLKHVDLEYLLDIYLVEKEINWGDELSPGEQQRLGMAIYIVLP